MMNLILITMLVHRERLADEKLASQAKRNEELRSQIQTVLEGLIDDMRVDVFSSIDKRLKEEKDALKGTVA